MQTAYATLRGALERHCCLLSHCSELTRESRAQADYDKRCAHDEALQRGEGGERLGVHVREEGQTSGHAVSQYGVVGGVTVHVHGQRGPLPRLPHAPRAPGGGEAPEAPPTEREWTERTAAAALAAAGEGRDALAQGDAHAAVDAYTRALRALAAGSESEAGPTFAQLHRARSAAFAAAGNTRRAQADAEDAEEAEQRSGL